MGQFDVALSERCLINLTSTDHQRRALGNIAAVVRPGGRFIFCEGSEDGRRRVNELRESAGLAPMPPIWHNLDFNEAILMQWLAPWYDVEEHAHFGLYDFLSRVLHPLLVAPESPKYDAKINELAARLSLSRRSDFAGVSRVLFLVLRRKPTPVGSGSPAARGTGKRDDGETDC
jgi:SAM-dependent methyltransferase